jgi:HD superfamily phosphodiesterase
LDLVTIKKLAYDLMGNRSSHGWKEKGNKYYHGQRVANLVLELRKIVLPGDDSHDEILTAAAWFHDIMNGNENHAAEGAKKTREVIRNYCSLEELDEVCEIISVHDDRYNGRDTYSDYIKLQQDADLLDHLGTYDIWMIIAYAVPHGQTFAEASDWIQNTRLSEDERYRKELNFEISRRILDEKSSFLKQYSDRFKVESMGGIWKEDEILSGYLRDKNSGEFA